jgi:hypothetical protein
MPCPRILPRNMYHTAYITAHMLPLSRILSRAYTASTVKPRRSSRVYYVACSLTLTPILYTHLMVFTASSQRALRAPGILPPAYIISPHALLRRILFGPGGELPVYCAGRILCSAPVPGRSSCYAPPTYIIVATRTATRIYYPIAYTTRAYATPAPPPGAPGILHCMLHASTPRTLSGPRLPSPPELTQLSAHLGWAFSQVRFNPTSNPPQTFHEGF